MDSSRIVLLVVAMTLHILYGLLCKQSLRQGLEFRKFIWKEIPGPKEQGGSDWGEREANGECN